LLIFERKILRRIFGPCMGHMMGTQGNGELEKNKELEQLYQRPDIVQEIKKRQLQWAGHSWRKEGSMIKLVQAGDPTSKRPLRHPRARWKDRMKK